MQGEKNRRPGAGADRDRFKNEGQAYANDVIPRARGGAARLIQEAEAYGAPARQVVEGEALSRPPKGFDAEHPYIGDIKRKSFFAMHQSSPKVAGSPALLDEVEATFRAAYGAEWRAEYDDFVVLYNEKFAKPGQSIMDALLKNGMRSKTEFDEEIEWTWFYLWHHEGRRARHGASMMAPDYTHWHGMYEVAERFYMELIPQAREKIEHAIKEGHTDQAKAVNDVIEAILAKPEHEWFKKGAEGDAEAIRKAMEDRYGKKEEGTKPPAKVEEKAKPGDTKAPPPSGEKK